MIGVGAEAIEARSMTSDLTDWHQALARGSAAEEEARQSLKRGLPYQNRPSAVHLIQTLGIKLRDILCLLPVSKAAAPNK